MPDTKQAETTRELRRELTLELSVDAAQTTVALDVEPELQAYAWELHATVMDFTSNERPQS